MGIDQRIAEIEARCEAATAGPWEWEITRAGKYVNLENGRYVVMGFARYGMDGAAPTFNVNGVMERADKLAKSIPGKEHHVGFDDYIDHPDARFIAHSRTDLSWAIARIKELEAENARLREAIVPSCPVKNMGSKPLDCENCIKYGSCALRKLSLPAPEQGGRRRTSNDMSSLRDRI